MINKKNIWFLTLFSLILVLSVYYITMPSDMLLTNFKAEDLKSDKETVSVEESNVISALKIEDEENRLEELDSFVKIDGNNIKIVVSSENKDTDVANKIMRSVQSNYESKKYITVEFK